jgi:signal transduction histidine kinase
MINQYINWKTYLILVALCIVGASLLYTNRLARELAEEEKKNVEQLVEGLKMQAVTIDPKAIEYAGMIVAQNKTIPLILTDDTDRIISTINLDSAKYHRDSNYFRKLVKEYKALHSPVVFDFGLGKQFVYFGESYLLRQLRYFPYVQLAIIFLFLVVVLIAFSLAHRSIQNQVWVGLSKETAHQLGTPLSSIVAWLELLKEKPENEEAVTEMQKDVDRLQLVADRFGKVGSIPKLEEENLIVRLRAMADYMQKRASSRVSISVKTSDEEIPVVLSGPLFDWVIENLIRNALDAMNEKGTIEIRVSDHPSQVWVDVCDSGKGIPKHMLKKIFNPGFSTKKRGWGLGLSLSKRIIEKYHHGSLYVKHSEVGKGTIFRVILKR